MKNAILLTGIVAVSMWADAALAGPASSLVVSLNEYGPGSFYSLNGGAAVAETYALPNQYGTANPPTLTYYYAMSGSPITAGDIVITDGLNGPASDIIRFGNYNNTTPYVSFYSLDNNGAPADNQTTTTSTIDIVEGTPYTPTSTQPGFVSGYQTTYLFYSAMPEPTTFAGFAGALALVPMAFTVVRSRRLGAKK